MGRKIRTTLPTLKKNLQPKCPNRLQVRETNASAKTQQAFYFNHGVRELPELKPGDVVLMKLDSEKLWKVPVQVKSEEISPCSFMVQAPNGEGGKRRNRRHLQSVPAEYPNAEITVQSQQTLGEAHIRYASQPESRTPSKTQGETLTRSGRLIIPIVKLDL